MPSITGINEVPSCTPEGFSVVSHVRCSAKGSVVPLGRHISKERLVFLVCQSSSIRTVRAAIMLEK